MDEESPLLPSRNPTPLPLFQLSILLFLQLSEPLTSNVIYPFAPDLIRNIGITNGDDKKVGYYVGLMQSIFFITEAATVFQWSRLSDRIGRKPVILFGLMGLSLSMYSFGLSSTFLGLVLSRCMNGVLNGNVGVMKSMMAEITDETNIAQAYAIAPVAWSTGASLGPLIGGSLSRPADQYPWLFGSNQFLKKYPYFLACAVPASFTMLACSITFFLKETVRNPLPVHHLFKSKLKGYNTKMDDSVETCSLAHTTADVPTVPLHIRAVMTPKVLIAAVNYASFSLVEIAFRAIQPVVYSTPIHHGGLGLSPPLIGNILCLYGFLNGLFQVSLFARIHHRWGSKLVFSLGLFAAIPSFALFPVINWIARKEDTKCLLWFAIGTQLGFSIFMNVSFGSIFIVIADATPTRASLGATTGFCQIVVSVMRAVGPAAANSLFSLSIENGYLGGHLVYVMLISIVGICLWMAMLLPKDSRRK